MNIETLRLKQNKMLIQQQEWHDEFTLKQKEYDQRDKHWFWQKGFWLFMAGVAIATIFLKSEITIENQKL